jgi:uncharacterized protein (TIGR02266 family)
MNTPETPQTEDTSRRAYLRSPVIVRQAQLRNGMEVFFGYAQNISRTGLFIGTTKMREPGAVFEIRFELPGGGTFQCKVEVMWSRPYQKASAYAPGLGLRFVDLPEEHAQIIDAWVQTTRAAPD